MTKRDDESVELEREVVRELRL
ncbi:hypothetical protein LCGC14_2337260, partial [marine sediment metagenome]